MKLTVLGGGGARIPTLVRAVVGDRLTPFDRIDLFEPAQDRRESLGRLSVELAGALGYPETVRVTADVEEALTGADYVFSAVRVGGDAGRIIDEQVALERGVVGQETTGPGGCAMALRTIPVVLGYCEVIARVAPRATLVNFTNPAGIITQAVTAQGKVRAVGVCDTPSQTLTRLIEFLGADPEQVTFSYGGLNHLGWISSVVVDGQERIDELVANYEALRAYSHRFAFDPDLVRRLGCIPTEYLYYFYDSAAYLQGVARAGTSRGEDVHRFNEALVKKVIKAFASGGVDDAWAAYSQVLNARRASNMRLDFEGVRAEVEDSSGPGPDPLEAKAGKIGGYEGVALRVIDGLSGAEPARVVVNTRNGPTLDFLQPDDVVEVPALVDAKGVAPLANAGLSGANLGLVLQVKEYERAVVQAALTGDAELAALALALHPLVPGLSAAKEMMRLYRERHRPYLDYLH
ncbi:MAG: 6-phospho-beta-glucosidase [Acidimicrobiales bacterium]